MHMHDATERRPAAGRLAGMRALIPGTGTGAGTGRGQGAAAHTLFCRVGATVVGCDVIAGAATQPTRRRVGAAR
jgi:hypothetical protein